MVLKVSDFGFAVQAKSDMELSGDLACLFLSLFLLFDPLFVHTHRSTRNAWLPVTRNATEIC